MKYKHVHKIRTSQWQKFREERVYNVNLILFYTSLHMLILSELMQILGRMYLFLRFTRVYIVLRGVYNLRLYHSTRPRNSAFYILGVLQR
jgi:hypothetical protein